MTKLKQKLTTYRHPTSGEREIMVAIGTNLRQVRIYLNEGEALELSYEMQRLARGQGGNPPKVIAETEQ